MERVKLTVNGLADSCSYTGAFVLVLSIAGNSKKLPIIIDQGEVQSIAKKITENSSFRPLVHEVFIQAAKKFNISIEEVLIYKFEEGVFFARVFFNSGEQHEFVEANVADAISLALHSNSPIYTTTEVVEKTGVLLSEEDRFLNSERYCFNLKEATIDALKQLMENAIAEEDYEYASIIRDEINSRNKKNNDK